jgi:hypothetical protein
VRRPAALARLTDGDDLLVDFPAAPREGAFLRAGLSIGGAPAKLRGAARQVVAEKGTDDVR